MNYLSCTYDPGDNKIRLSSISRLDQETYERVKAAGFKWAPNQKIFIAPMWTPGRADLMIELCGEIGDEDSTLVDRAAIRAGRFEGYSESRTADAESAYKAVSAIADGIPLGQPILLGHHSEKHARRDAEKIENGMRRAVRMWDTASYWKQRAAGALRNAKYKELPGARARRIKTLEADKRRHERTVQKSEMWLKLWNDCANEPDQELQKGVALRLAGMCHLTMPRKEGDRKDLHSPSAYDAVTGDSPTLFASRTLEEVFAAARDAFPKTINHAVRWLDHLNNRIEYERTMLGESGGLAHERFDIQAGGKVLVGETWVTVLRVNRSGGAITSVTTNSKYVSLVSIERVKGYLAPDPEDVAKVNAATKLPPLVNYPGEGFLEMTMAEWKRKPKDYRQTRATPTTDKFGRHRYRMAFVPGGSYRTAQVYITDAKRVDLPPVPPEYEPLDPPESVRREPRQYIAPEPTKFDAMKDSLKAGVQVVAAPQLFPTPKDLAARIVEMAGIEPTHRILEPSAGTGALLDACKDRLDARWITCATVATIVAVEIHSKLAEALKTRYPLVTIMHADFLQLTDTDPGLSGFDRVVMNPPFADAQDIAHVQHAYRFLVSGGVLVSVMCSGPFFRSDRKSTQFRDWLDAIDADVIDLPADTFKESGTGVSTKLVRIRK